MKVSASSSARHPTPKVAEAAGPDPSLQAESTDNVSDDTLAADHVRSRDDADQQQEKQLGPTSTSKINKGGGRSISGMQAEVAPQEP